MEEKKRNKLIQFLIGDTEFSIRYKDFPDMIKRKIMNTIGIFCGIGLLVALCSITMGKSLLWCGGFLIIAGIVFSLQIYMACATNQMVEAEGVIVGFEKSGYRKQNTFLLVMTENKTFFKVLITEKKHFYYKKSDIIRFYTNERSLEENYSDGLYTLRTVYAIERLQLESNIDDDPAIKKALDDLKEMQKEENE